MFPIALRIASWITRTFGRPTLLDRRYRAARVLEEAVELAQAEGVDRIRALSIVLGTYDKPPGRASQEAGAVMVCMHAWAIAAGQDLRAVCAAELGRIEALPAEHFRMRRTEKAAAGIDELATDDMPPCGPVQL